MNVCSVCQRCYEETVEFCAEAGHGGLTKKNDKKLDAIENYRFDRLLENRLKTEIYRSRHLPSEKEVLVHFVKTDQNHEQTENLQKEIQSVSLINNPNLARVYESGTFSDEEFYFVQEISGGETLHECLTKKGRLPEREAVLIARQVAEGLETLHNAGIFHRAVNPKNIIFTEAENENFAVKLQNLDFGGIRQQAVAAGANAVDAQTDALVYLSPEQLSDSAVEAQTDIYSLGVVLYEMLCGRLPYDAPNAQAIFNFTFSDKPFETLRFDVRALISHLLREAMQKRTNLRPPNAGNLARQLRHIEQLVAPPPIAFREFQPAPPHKKSDEIKAQTTIAPPEVIIATIAKIDESPAPEVVRMTEEIAPATESFSDSSSLPETVQNSPEIFAEDEFSEVYEAEEIAAETENIAAFSAEEDSEKNEPIEETTFAEETVFARFDEFADDEPVAESSFDFQEEFDDPADDETEFADDFISDENLIEYETIDAPQYLESQEIARRVPNNLVNSFDAYSEKRRDFSGKRMLYAVGAACAFLVLLGLSAQYFSGAQEETAPSQSVVSAPPPQSAPIALPSPAVKIEEPLIAAETNAPRDEELEPLPSFRENNRENTTSSASEKNPVESKPKRAANQPRRAVAQSKPAAKQIVSPPEPAPIKQTKPTTPKGDGLTRPRIVKIVN